MAALTVAIAPGHDSTMSTREISGSRDLVWQPSRRPLQVGSANAVGTPDGGGKISLARAARGALRWWGWALTAWVVASAGLCTAIYTVVKPAYEASSLLRVEPASHELFGMSQASDNSYQNFMETQVQLITNPNVLTAAATGPGAAGMPTFRAAADPEAELRKKVLVKILPKSYLIEVSTVLPSPTEAAAAVNAVVGAYLAADAEWSEGMTMNQIKNLETYRSSLQVQVDEKQKAWLALAARGNAPVDPAAGHEPGGESTKTSISIEEYKRVRSQLLEAPLALAEAEAVRDFRLAQAEAIPDAHQPQAADLEAVDRRRLPPGPRRYTHPERAGRHQGQDCQAQADRPRFGRSGDHRPSTTGPWHSRPGTTGSGPRNILGLGSRSLPGRADDGAAR